MFKFKKPTKKTKEIMSEVALEYTSKDYESLCEDKIKKITSHNYGKITNSGNGSILIGLSAIEGNILIPDQGGWSGFKQIANFLNKKILTLKTEKGIIKPENIDEATKNEEASGLILTSFGGYSAEQDMKSISKYCKDNNILLIEDASAGICDSKGKLGNGKYSDIILASTGSPKIINVGSGGFITTNKPEVFERTKLTQKIAKTNEIISAGIYTELNFTKDNLKKTMKGTKYLKDNLENVIHKDKRGVNVIIKDNNPKKLAYNLKKELIIDYNSFITKCPNYNRVKEKAVAIEIKNLEVTSLKKDNLDKIINSVEKFKNN